MLVRRVGWRAGERALGCGAGEGGTVQGALSTDRIEAAQKSNQKRYLGPFLMSPSHTQASPLLAMATWEVCVSDN